LYKYPWDWDSILDQSIGTISKFQQQNDRIKNQTKQNEPDLLHKRDLNFNLLMSWEKWLYLKHMRGVSHFARLTEHFLVDHLVSEFPGFKKCDDRMNLKKSKQLSCGTTTVSGDASDIRCSCVMKGFQDVSLFIGKDNGDSVWEKEIPPCLHNRISKSIDFNSDHIRYISMGPNDFYFVRFCTGDCWWDFGQYDEDLHKILRNYDIYRLAFGPIIDSNINVTSKSTFEMSWILSTFDGKVAWRNIPKRLEKLLTRRSKEMASISEISLGCEGAYFVKFLDGQLDYCLPALVEKDCESIIQKGGFIANISLCANSSHDYIIRYSI